jgi:hypothetical protein
MLRMVVLQVQDFIVVEVNFLLIIAFKDKFSVIVSFEEV